MAWEEVPSPPHAGKYSSGLLSLQKKTSLWLLHTENMRTHSMSSAWTQPCWKTPSRRLAWSLNLTIALSGFPPPPVRQLGAGKSPWLWTCTHLPRAFSFSCVGLHLMKTSPRDIPTCLDIPVCNWWEFCLLYLKRQLSTRGARGISGCKLSSWTEVSTHSLGVIPCFKLSVAYEKMAVISLHISWSQHPQGIRHRGEKKAAWLFSVYLNADFCKLIS